MTANVSRRELKSVISTNGVVEPIERSDVLAAFDGIVRLLSHQEGDLVVKGERLLQVDSDQLAISLASAKAALLQAQRQAQPVLAGPPKDEMAGIESAVSETELELRKKRQDLQREENLLKREATTRVDVENLRDQVNLLEARLEALRQKKQNLVNRFSPQEKEWEANKVKELRAQVELLTMQMASGSVLAPRSGRIYGLNIRTGAYVSKGQLLAQIYEPGHIRVKAYVDEPDLGRIAKGQPIEIEWDGLPDKRWPGKVEQPAQQVLPLGNRSVGYVFCSVEGNPVELIPNINLKLEIVTSRKLAALVVPRAAVFNHEGQSTVSLDVGGHTVLKRVVLGMVTPLEVEILQGLEEGNRIVINPGEVPAP
jgi:HlyD family secretion protein